MMGDFCTKFHVFVVITPPFPQDGGTVRIVIQVHTANVIEIRLGQWFSTFPIPGTPILKILAWGPLV